MKEFPILNAPELENHPAVLDPFRKAVEYLERGDIDAAGNNMRKALEGIYRQYSNDDPLVLDSSLHDMVSSCGARGYFTAEETAAVEAARRRGNAASHADGPLKKDKPTLPQLESDLEMIASVILPKFLSKFPRPVERKNKIHPQFHIKDGLAPIMDIFEDVSYYYEPGDDLRREPFFENGVLHLRSAARWYEEEILLFGQGRSGIARGGRLNIPAELRTVFGFSSLGREKYVDQYHKTGWRLTADYAYSVLETARALLSYSGDRKVAYVPGLSAGELEIQAGSFIQARSETAFGFDPRFDALLADAKVIVLPDERSVEHYDPLPETSVRKIAPNCRFVVGEEFDKLRSLLEVRKGRRTPVAVDPYGRKDLDGVPVTFGAGRPDDKELNDLMIGVFGSSELFYCFANALGYDLADVDITGDIARIISEHPGAFMSVRHDRAYADASEFDIPDWFYEEAERAGVREEDLLALLLKVQTVYQPLSPEGLPGDKKEYHRNSLMTPIRKTRAAVPGGAWNTVLPRWFTAEGQKDDESYCKYAVRDVRDSNPIKQQLLNFLKSVPFETKYSEDGVLMASGLDGLCGQWQLTEKDLEWYYASMHRGELRAQAEAEAARDGREAPLYEAGDEVVWDLVHGGAEDRLGDAGEKLGGSAERRRGLIDEVRYSKDEGVVYDIVLLDPDLDNTHILYESVPQTLVQRRYFKNAWRRAATKEERSRNMNEFFDSIVFTMPDVMNSERGAFWTKYAEDLGEPPLYLRLRCADRKKAVHDADDRFFEYMRSVCPNGLYPEFKDANGGLDTEKYNRFFAELINAPAEFMDYPEAIKPAAALRCPERFMELVSKEARAQGFDGTKRIEYAPGDVVNFGSKFKPGTGRVLYPWPVTRPQAGGDIRKYYEYCIVNADEKYTVQSPSTVFKIVRQGPLHDKYASEGVGEGAGRAASGAASGASSGAARRAAPASPASAERAAGRAEQSQRNASGSGLFGFIKDLFGSSSGSSSASSAGASGRTGSGAAESPRYCSACGNRLNPGDRFCGKCGRKL